MTIEDLRDRAKIGDYSLIDFVLSYLVVIIIWIIGLIVSSWNGLILLKLLLSVIPLSIGIHMLFNIKTKNGDKTPMVKDFLSLNCSTTSILTKIIVIGSIGFIAFVK